MIPLKKILITAVAAGYLFIISDSFLTLASFSFNYNYIVKELCINRNKPEKKCNGKCYLSKKLAEENKQESTSGKEEANISFSPHLIPAAADDTMPVFSRVSYNNWVNIFIINDIVSSLFHPPPSFYC